LTPDAHHPIANSYWLPGGQVLASEYPRSDDEAGSTERLRALRPVYVHCYGGVGRTGTVAGCLLIEHGASGEEALTTVADLFGTMSPEKVRRHRYHGSPETEQQRQFVRAWSMS